MKLRSVLLLLLLTLCGCRQSSSGPPSKTSLQTVVVDPATAGSISGTISFQGLAIYFPALDMSADPGCPSGPQPSDAFVLSNGKLANVFVYIKEGLQPGAFNLPTEAVVLDQKGCRYVPHVLGIMAGQPLKILNSDNADHNIHAMSVANPQWNESQSANNPPITRTFFKPEMMAAVQCNQHPWMRAYINVMSHPYYAVSGTDGKFEIRNLPPGEYTLAAIHEKFGERIAKVKVGPRETIKADFAFTAGE